MQKRNNGDKMAANYGESSGMDSGTKMKYILLLVGVIIIVLAYFALSNMSKPKNTSTIATTMIPTTTMSSMQGASFAQENISMLNFSDLKNLYGNSPLFNGQNPYFTESINRLQVANSICQSGIKGYLASFGEPYDVFTNASLASGLNKTIPILIYSSYLQINNNNFNIAQTAFTCPSNSKAFASKLYVANYSITNVSGQIGVPALLFQYKNFTPMGLNASNTPYKGQPPSLSFYFIKFKYKDTLWTIGDWAFSNNITSTQLIALSKTVYARLLSNNA